MHHIFSTLANSNEYIRYSDNGPRGVNLVERSILIKGGTGVNHQNIGTPLGVHTAVSDEDYEWLKENFSFKQHVSAGYITVQKHKADPEVVAADMATRQWKGENRGDAFPVSPNDFSGKPEKEGLTAIEPKTNKKKAA